MMRMVITVASFLLGTTGAAAQDRAADAPRNYGNFRIGASGDALGGREELCLELQPLAYLSIEGCGTGSGFLHRDPAPELGHFRAKVRVARWPTRLGWLETHVGAGFVELQIGEDSPGFHFTGTDDRRVETSGPEAGASLRLLSPISKGWEVVTSLGAYVAWVPYADELIEPVSVVQPSIALSFGVGF